MQPKPTRRRRPPASDITPETPIWCPACQVEHPASQFNVERRRFSGLSGICREAQQRQRQTAEGKAKTLRVNQRRWSRADYRQKSREWQRARRERLGSNHDLSRARARLKAIVDDWKARGCVDCGYGDIQAIDPDHLDSDLKDNHVSRLVQLCASRERIVAELAKCVPRCARCHRQVTHNQRPAAWRAAEHVPPSWRRRLEMQDRNDVIKMERGCDDCDWAGWARGLDWDHVRGEKVASIANLIANGRPSSEIDEEVAKCDLVCANCHRIRTIERRSRGASSIARSGEG